MPSKKIVVAPCGLDCFNCELYQDNLTEKLAELIAAKSGIAKADVACAGCREMDGRHFHLPEGCATLECVKKKGLELCSDCPDFPCELLAPLADQAGRYPHNFKLYNLCRIQRIGLDRWAEEAATIRGKYFKAPFKVGKGQAE